MTPQEPLTRTEGRVVVGVSGSPSSLAALRRAAQEARAGNRPLLAVRAWAPPEGEAAHRVAPCPPLARRWEEQVGTELAAALVDNRPYLAGVQVSSQVVRASAWFALTRLAGEDDLLVIGGGGRGRLARALYGATRRLVQAHARGPVLTVEHPTPRRAELRELRCIAEWTHESVPG